MQKCLNSVSVEQQLRNECNLIIDKLQMLMVCNYVLGIFVFATFLLIIFLILTVKSQPTHYMHNHTNCTYMYNI